MTKRKLPPKEVFTIDAGNGDTMMRVEVMILPSNLLVESEINALRTTAIRAFAKALETLPYTDYGIDNIVVTP